MISNVTRQEQAKLNCPEDAILRPLIINIDFQMVLKLITCSKSVKIAKVVIKNCQNIPIKIKYSI